MEVIARLYHFLSSSMGRTKAFPRSTSLFQINLALHEKASRQEYAYQDTTIELGYLMNRDCIPCLTVDKLKGEHQFQMVIRLDGFCALGRVVETDHIGKDEQA